MTEEPRQKAPHDLHDRGFKELFQNQDAFLDLLQHFIADPWVWRVGQEVKLFQLSSNEFVTEDFAKLQSDIVYQLHFTEEQEDHSSEDFFVLLEFQSSVDSRIVVRLYHYIYEIQRQAFKTGKTNNEVPLVLPIVLYDGRERWTAPMYLHELTGQAIRPMLSSGVKTIDPGYYFLDVKRYSIDELLAMKSPVACVFALDNVEKLEDIQERIGAIQASFASLDIDQQKLVTDWIEHVAVQLLPSAAASKLRKAIQELLEGKGDTRMSNLGRVLAEGLEEKEQEAKREIARNMLRKGLDVDLIVEVTELSQEEVEHLAEEVKTAK